MNILVITGSFPSESNSFHGMFVYNTVKKFDELGHKIVVVSPQPFRLYSDVAYEKIGNIEVYRPRYFSIGGRKIPGINCRKYTHLLFSKAVLRQVEKFSFEPDVIYSHFLAPGGLSALQVAKKLKKKVFCTLGESDFHFYDKYYSRNFLARCLNSFTEVFPNNVELEDFIVSSYSDSANTFYIPNGVDINLFRPIEKQKCRKELGLPAEGKIVIFVGGFEERKGPKRVHEACSLLEHTPLQIYLGAGDLGFQSDNLLHVGKASHTSLPLYLNASDVFVFPSKSEGMPNALLEAMACQIPIVASNIPVNEGLLKNYKQSVLVPSEDIDAIAEGINLLMINRLEIENRKFEYTLEHRAKSLISRMSSME